MLQELDLSALQRDLAALTQQVITNNGMSDFSITAADKMTAHYDPI